MINSHLILQAINMRVTHPLLRHALTPLYLDWLSSPSQLPIPFPTLPDTTILYLLDMATLNWQDYQLRRNSYNLP